jgi:cbb3-type cytochrome oxidase subunit 3
VGAGGVEVHAASTPRIATTMWLLILEALAALGLLIFLVWWTMFSGRRKGERDNKRNDRR